MKDETIFLWYLLLLYNKISYTEPVCYTISRRASHANVGIESDNFAIPDSNCGDVDCGSHNALDNTQLGRCNCVCPSTKSTFAFTTENQGMCIDDSEVRTKLQSDQYSQQGEKACSKNMKTLFINEHQNSSLTVLNYGDQMRVPIDSSSSSCGVDTGLSWYFECNASRLSSPGFRKTLSNAFKFSLNGQSHHRLKVEGTPNTHMFNGRIINLGILCSGNTTSTQHCLLFKFQGTMRCNLSDSSSTKTSTDALAVTSSLVHETAMPSRTAWPSISSTIQPTSTIKLSTPSHTVILSTMISKSSICSTPSSTKTSTDAVAVTSLLVHETAMSSRTAWPSISSTIQPTSTIRLSTPSHTVILPTMISKSSIRPTPCPDRESSNVLIKDVIILAILVIVAFIALLLVMMGTFWVYRYRYRKQERANHLIEGTISSRQISQSSPEETDAGDRIMEEASFPERSSDYAYANLLQSFSEETDTGYMTIERASCSERTYDYPYTIPLGIIPPPLISRSTRTGCVPADASLGCLGDDASANQQSPPSVKVRSTANYIDKNYEDTNRPTDPEEYVEMGKRRDVEFADSADKCGRNGLSKEEEGPGNQVLVETGKFRSSAISPDKHYENTSVKNKSSDEGENDERLRLNGTACGLSYENPPRSSTSHFSVERTDPVEYVEMAIREEE